MRAATTRCSPPPSCPAPPPPFALSENTFASVDNRRWRGLPSLLKPEGPGSRSWRQIGGRPRQRLPGHPDVSDVISSYPQAARPRHAHAAAGAPRLPRAATDASLIPRRKYMRPSSTLKRLALALVLLLAPFGSAQPQTAIRIAIPGEGDTLDPAYMSFVNSFAVATNVYSGLVRYAPGTIDLMPDLATEWAVSDDGL